MDVVSIVAALGPVAGTVLVVVLFVRFATSYMKNEREHREKLADDCHKVQAKATEATFKAIGSIDNNSEVLEKVNVTLIKMNGTKL